MTVWKSEDFDNIEKFAKSFIPITKKHLEMKGKSLLGEIVIIRIVLVLCLVLYHSFSPFAYTWDPISPDYIAPYYWVGKVSYSFFLGSFVFISGYLYGFSDLKKGTQPFMKVIKKKGTRLLIPSFVFSALYLLLFGFRNGETPVQAAYSILAGRGHMWFLPMLFWLFVGIEVLKRIKISPIIILAVTFVASIAVVLPLPLQINTAFSYLFLFYLGYICKAIPLYQPIADMNVGGGKTLVISTLIYVLFFLLTELVLAESETLHGLERKILNLIVFYGKIIYTIAGTIFIYVLALRLINKSRIKISYNMVKLSGLCFGIYLYQQFILKYLYYHTAFTDHIGILGAPWVAFIITLILSAGLSYLTLQTRLGRALIG